VTPDAQAKTHFVIVDCVGISDTELADTQPLERKKSVSFKALLEHVAQGGTDPDLLSSLASRLARLQRQCGPTEDQRIAEVSDGVPLGDITHAIIEALDPDRHREEARSRFAVPDGEEPTEEQIEEAREDLCRKAVEPLATKPPLRELLLIIKQQFEQILDEISVDHLLFAGTSEEAKKRAKDLTQSFEQFLEENRDEIDALQFFYSQPYDRRLRYKDIKALAQAIELPPRSWTPERLWRAYEILDRGKVRGSAQRVLTDLVSLVRFALHQEVELAPYPDHVQGRFDGWLLQQENRGRRFTPQQKKWLEMIRDHIATSLEMDIDDFGYTPFVEQGGLGRAVEVFGGPPALRSVLDELNQELAA
jgi:type I restriction enzyme R subunit